jgi:hypothetical protein
MELEKYDLVRNDVSFNYEFYSEGPRGRVKKIVRFQKLSDEGKNVFNLAFGDLDESTGLIDDLAITNNNDRLKILKTVALAVADFIEFRPNAFVVAKGSTLSRTRLYQMGMSSFWSEISQQYNIYGKLGKEWLPFQKGVNYERFLIFKKN